MKFIIRAVLALIAVLLLVYLLLPQPKYPPPLPNSLKSTEEGDTVQIPRVSAYYSQNNRALAIRYYQDQFTNVPGLPLRFPSYRLNHPPQFSHEKIRDELLSSYFEEVVHPFRESLFINGWEPGVFFAGNPGAMSQYEMIVDGKKFSSKTTLRPFYSPVLARLANFVGIILSTFLLYYLTKRIVFESHR